MRSGHRWPGESVSRTIEQTAIRRNLSLARRHWEKTLTWFFLWPFSFVLSAMMLDATFPIFSKLNMSGKYLSRRFANGNNT